MHRFTRVISFLELVGAVSTMTLMICLIAVAIAEIALGVGNLIFISPAGVNRPPDLGRVLAGIEYLFLAPLPFLAYTGVVKLIHGHFIAMSERPEDYVNPYSKISHYTKRSVSSLAVAILLTDLLERAIENGTRDWLQLVGECSAVVLGLAYLFISHRTDDHA